MPKKHTRPLLEEPMVADESPTEPRKKRQVYRCFLVRCRLEEDAVPGAEPAWRFSVQQVGPDAARRSFTSIHDVAAHIEAELAYCAGYGAQAHQPTRSEKEKKA